jgi:peptidoglycan L-alanyl-D-glutamate endopeptidase CwlK
MKDQKTLDRIQLMHPKLRAEVAGIYDEICQALNGRAFCRFSYTLRTFREQDELYCQGRTKAGKKVTNAKGGYSYHNYGLALDIVLIVDQKTAVWDIKTDFDGDGKPDWMQVVHIFKSHGWDWGGDWKFTDYPHFQKSFGYKISDLLEMHKLKKYDSNGYLLI